MMRDTMPALRVRFATSLLVLVGCGGVAATADRGDGGMAVEDVGPDAASTVDATVPGDAGTNEAGDSAAEGATPADSGVDSVAPIDAGPPPPAQVLVQACAPTGIAVDATGIYWADLGGGSGPCSNPGIWRANLDGSNVTSLVGYVYDTIVFPQDVVLYGDHVYWDNTGATSPTSLPPISGCPKVGCSAGERIPLDAGTFTYATGLAVSDAGMFWVGNAPPFSWNSVWRVVQDDAGASSALVQGLLESGGLALDGTNVYFGEYGSTRNASLVGSVATGAPPLVDASAVSPFAPIGWLPVLDGGALLTLPQFAVDDTTLYFAFGFGETVGAMPKAGVADGGAATVFAWVDGPLHIVVDDANVYFTALGPNSGTFNAPVFNQGSVMKCPKTGCGAGGPTVMATGLPFYSGTASAGAGGFLAADATYLYFTVVGDGTIRRIPK